MIISDWLNYLINDDAFLGYIRSLALRSLHQANLNPSRFSAVHIPVPPIDEQKKIFKSISNMSKEFDNQILISQREIDLYEELRQTYIANAVTGKIKV